MICEMANIPHPRFMEDYGMEWQDIVDWQGYLLWKHGDNEQQTDADKIQFLNDLKERWGK